MSNSSRFPIFYLIYTIISTIIIIALCIALLPRRDKNLQVSITEPEKKSPITVIIDAGHGGEDGGTSSASGLCEKDINLDLSVTLCEMLTLGGVNVVMTRTDDRLLYDRNIDFRGRKKILDLAARHSIEQETENAIFISIHMNAFTDPRYSGLQVWYSPNHPDSSEIAGRIQENTQKHLQPENHRKIKKAGSDIYLLDRATSPAVLVECGFLSNVEEAKKLGSSEYRQKLAFIMFSSIMQYISLHSESSEISNNDQG